MAEFEGCLKTLFYFSSIWGIGGSLHDKSKDEFDAIVRKTIDGVFLPGVESVYEVVPD